METQIECKKCGSKQFALQKNGFNGKNAFIAFVIVAISLGGIWFAALENQKSAIEIHNKIEMEYHFDTLHHRSEVLRGEEHPYVYVEPHIQDNPVLIGGTIFVLILSLLIGFKGSQINNRVCLGCGEKTIL